MRLNKDDIYSLIGTVAFHGVILLILWFTVLKTEVPDEDGGVLVNFGNVDAAAGMFEPKYTGQEPPQETTTPPPPVPEPQVETPKQELITQDIEESVALEDAKKKKEEEKRKKQEAEKKRKEEEEKERIRREEAEKNRLAEERRKKEQAISNKVAGAFGMGNAEGNSQGDAESGTGNQGSPFGNSDHGANEGVGGYGSFNLNGRSIGAGGLPRPAYTIQEEGRIVINITVDPKGNVIFAEVGRGTNIDNASMRKSALDAARKAKFNSISGANNQSGTITYVYKFKSLNLMKKAIVFLANGFEEMEATGTVDILRRGGIDTKTVSITDDRKVIGAHNMEYTADATFTEIDLSDADALILPGGMPGASNLNNSEPVKEVLLQQYREGRIVAAICAAPMVLGGLGLLKGRKATCYPGFEPKLIGATVTGEAVEVDGNVVTGRGPGLVFNFGLALVSVLKGDAVAEEVAAGLLL